jgi:hypothetical protein
MQSSDGSPRDLPERAARRAPSARWLGLSLWVLALAHCGRTGLDPYDVFEADLGVAGGAGTTSRGGNAGAKAARDAEVPPEAPADATPDAPTEAPDDVPPDAEPPPDAAVPMDATVPEPCVPSPESCNRIDDDCNGLVDDLSPLACPGGGFKHCVAGAMSTCPTRCEVCIPGSVRICQNSFCTFWGEQECAADGQGFGPCRERRPPSACAETARKHQRSPELERCCIDNGYCCADEFDLDGDGDRAEMLGACEAVRCD